MKKVKKNNINFSNLNNFTFLWNDLKDCWAVEFSLESFYNVLSISTEANAYKNKITNWVAKNWLYLINDKNEIIDNPKELNKVIETFSIPSFKHFKEQYFTHYFCSGDLYFYKRLNVLGDIKAQLLDSRTMSKYVDNLWNIIWFKQKTAKDIRDLPVDDVYNSIVRYNVNNPFYWISVFYSILYDVLTERETQKTQYYFFKNKAVPNVLFILDPEITKEQAQDLDKQIKLKYGGAENNNKAILSNDITDIKILDLNSKDLNVIWLREFLIQKIWIVFGIDPRIIWFVKDVGSYASIKEIKKEAMETLNILSLDFENDLNYFYKNYVDKKFPFKIRVDSETFTDRETIEEGQRKDVELWLQTIEMVWSERGYNLDNLPENAKKPLIKNNLRFLEQNETNNII